MPFKRTKNGSYVSDPNGSFRIIGARGGLFTRVVSVIRDSLHRPLRWNDKIKDYEIDTARWIQEVNDGQWKNPNE